MSNFLHSLPRGLLVFLVLVVGIAFIVFSNPPHTICDTQIETLNETLKGSVFLDKSRPMIHTTGLRYRHDLCWRLNDSGGCYEYFAMLRSVIKDLRSVSPQCWGTVGGVKEIRTAILDAVSLLVRVAWGATAPRSYMERFGWLSSADIALYCDLQRLMVDFYGQAGLLELREKLMGSLPGTDKLRREAVWSRSLLSTRCEQYR